LAEPENGTWIDIVLLADATAGTITATGLANAMNGTATNNELTSIFFMVMNGFVFNFDYYRILVP